MPETYEVWEFGPERSLWKADVIHKMAQQAYRAVVTQEEQFLREHQDKIEGAVLAVYPEHPRGPYAPPEWPASPQVVRGMPTMYERLIALIPEADEAAGPISEEDAIARYPHRWIVYGYAKREASDA